MSGVSRKISNTDTRANEECECTSHYERLEARIETLSRLNAQHHDRILDLEAQVIKANENLKKVLDGMEKFIQDSMLPIIKIPMIDTLRYVKSLIDWSLTIDVSRFKEENSFRK